ncbi:MAG TPA: hypothetical protein PKO06_19270, partial [Candidatus Ozemobacteraceae bacterium]|nr:hypothetical protein [Candidatus Ozemobacteraceae bacterium]
MVRSADEKRLHRLRPFFLMVVGLLICLAGVVHAAPPPTIASVASIPVVIGGTTYASTSGNITFVGTADPSAFVRLYNGTTEVGASVVDALGSWSIVVPGVAAGFRNYRAYSISYPTLVQQSATAAMCFDVAVPTGVTFNDSVLANNDPNYDFTVDNKIYYNVAAADALSGVASIHLQVATNSGFLTPVFDGLIATTSPYCFPGATASNTYFARIRAFDRAGNVSGWTAAATMTRVVQESMVLPSVPMLTTVGGKPANSGATLYFSAATLSVKGNSDPF